MPKSSISLAALCSLAAMFVGPSATAQGLCNTPQWFPGASAEAMARAYPARALAEHVEGWAVLRCARRADGRLVDCVVRSEGPVGYGFGAAALTVAPDLGAGGCADHPERIIRREQDVPVKFRLPA